MTCGDVGRGPVVVGAAEAVGRRGCGGFNARAAVGAMPIPTITPLRLSLSALQSQHGDRD